MRHLSTKRGGVVGDEASIVKEVALFWWARKKRISELLCWFLLGVCLHWISNLSTMMDFVEVSAPPQKVLSKNQNATDTITTETKLNSNIKYIFFVGLEGTGHHLVGSMLKNSPLHMELKEMGLEDNENELRKALHKSLFNYAPGGGFGGAGLWDSHCSSKINSTRHTQMLKRRLIKQIEKINTQVTEMKKVNDNHDDDVLVYPINTMVTKGGFGEVSYPNFSGSCRFLNYPNLDLWYDVCHDANVDCEHIYVYRDPLAILQSTSIKRKFNKSTLSGIYLYSESTKLSNFRSKPRNI